MHVDGVGAPPGLGQHSHDLFSTRCRGKTLVGPHFAVRRQDGELPRFADGGYLADPLHLRTDEVVSAVAAAAGGAAAVVDPVRPVPRVASPSGAFAREKRVSTVVTAQAVVAASPSAAARAVDPAVKRAASTQGSMTTPLILKGQAPSRERTARQSTSSRPPFMTSSTTRRMTALLRCDPRHLVAGGVVRLTATSPKYRSPSDVAIVDRGVVIHPRVLVVAKARASRSPRAGLERVIGIADPGALRGREVLGRLDPGPSRGSISPDARSKTGPLSRGPGRPS